MTLCATCGQPIELEKETKLAQRIGINPNMLGYGITNYSPAYDLQGVYCHQENWQCVMALMLKYDQRYNIAALYSAPLSMPIDQVIAGAQR